MIVKALIDKLKILPPDLPVLVRGYEDGFDGIKSVREITVVRNLNAKDYNGEYDDAEANAQGAVKSVMIMGNRR